MERPNLIKNIEIKIGDEVVFNSRECEKCGKVHDVNFTCEFFALWEEFTNKK